jgi:hypothetical protein
MICMTKRSDREWGRQHDQAQQVDKVLNDKIIQPRHSAPTLHGEPADRAHHAELAWGWIEEEGVLAEVSGERLDRMRRGAALVIDAYAGLVGDEPGLEGVNPIRFAGEQAEVELGEVGIQEGVQLKQGMSVGKRALDATLDQFVRELGLGQ